MDETVYALFYKKYSLNTVKLQILSQLTLILLACILSLIKFKINDNYVLLSMNQILIIASYLFMIGGLINGSTEVENPESKIVYLLTGNKNSSAQKIIIVELIDCVLQAILSFLIISFFLFFKGTIEKINLIVFISYVLSTTLCSFIAYYLTLFFKSSMVALATLLIFPILVLPYIERVLSATSPYIYYEAISESFKTSVISTSHIVLLFWNFIILLSIYLKIKKGVNNG
ncbi:hypothetical protein [Streptococcus sp. HMSC076C08]|jgi:hypothetical protein|uniref:hypothetical protein n=1 Tax=Streptococcus sp. HMSC076C08 TaxID=1739270 RepID=UPI0008A5C198|nr:hypothetical protein [Streptococcus sp. HMSC076C08]OFL47633.1 hypothetical protein HMPREF2766_01850 [Streptococcus sp. HMSC076C08]